MTETADEQISTSKTNGHNGKADLRQSQLNFISDKQAMKQQQKR